MGRFFEQCVLAVNEKSSHAQNTIQATSAWWGASAQIVDFTLWHICCLVYSRKHLFQDNFPEAARVQQFRLFLAKLRTFEICNYALRRLRNVHSKVVKGYR